MNSTALVNKIKAKSPAYTRVEIRELIDSEQKFIYSKAQPILRLYDSTTGKDPILTTVAGQSVYEINITNGYADDVWKVTDVRSYDGTDVSITDEYGDTKTVRTIPASGASSAKDGARGRPRRPPHVPPR